MPDALEPTLVFGGTFDPPHHAHATIPAQVAATLGLPRILYVPARRSPLRDAAPAAPAQHRRAMLALAIEDVPGAEISTVELDRDGPSWTIDTLEILRAAGHGPMRLLVGGDQALAFHNWRSPDRIIELAEPAVVLRPPMSADDFAEALAEHHDADAVAAWRIRLVDVPTMDVSASAVRARLDTGDDVSDMVNARVLDHILRHGLYGVTVIPERA